MVYRPPGSMGGDVFRPGGGAAAATAPDAFDPEAFARWLRQRGHGQAANAFEGGGTFATQDFAQRNYGPLLAQYSGQGGAPAGAPGGGSGGGGGGGGDGFDVMVDSALGQYGETAHRLEAEEERRGAAWQDYLERASASANVPTITDETIRRQFASRSDSATGDFLDRMGSLREYMGSSGVTGGGVTAGIAANAEVERLRAMTQTRGDLMAFKATQDALDRQRAFDRAQAVGQAIARPVSMLGADYANQALATRLTQLGVERNYQGAIYGANAQRQASESASRDSLIGSLAGGAFGILGSLI